MHRNCVYARKLPRVFSLLKQFVEYFMRTAAQKQALLSNPNVLVVSGRDFAAIQKAIANPPKANAALKAAFVQFCKECPESAREIRNGLRR